MIKMNSVDNSVCYIVQDDFNFSRKVHSVIFEIITVDSILYIEGGFKDAMSFSFCFCDKHLFQI